MLKKFLEKRYHDHMVKAMMEFFRPEEDVTYETYWCMLDKIMYVSEEKQRELVFRMFDINED